MKSRSTAIGVLALLAIVAIRPDPAAAQIGKLKDKIKQKVEQKKVECPAGDVVKDGRCVKGSGSSAASSGNAGTDATEGGESGASAQEKPAATLRPGEGAWANFDFVPGERVLFVDDFSKDRVGNFPKRLELINGSGEIVEWPAGSGKRWLSFKADDDAEGFYINLPEELPQRFTVEFDVVIPWDGFELYVAREVQKDPYATEHGRIRLAGYEVGALRPGGDEGSKLDPRDVMPDFYGCGQDECENENSRPFKARLQVDGKYVKFYLDEQRIANVPNLELNRTNRLVFHFRGTNVNGKHHPAMLANISVNAGGKEMYDALIGDGRVAVQGIYFDTGKDRIRPESSGTLLLIAEMLQEHADLKLVIEGHTDDVGDAAANQKLSESRAAAVVAALSAAPYKVSAERLKSIGFGASKPAQPNTTPEGRQANRRVELAVQK